MMYGLPGGFTITMYSGTHKLKPGRNTIHKDCGVRVKLSDNMVIIWNEATVHAASKSRQEENGKFLQDM